MRSSPQGLNGDPLAELAKLIETSAEAYAPGSFDEAFGSRYVTELFEPESYVDKFDGGFVHNLVHHIPPVHPVTPRDAIAELPIFSTPRFVARLRGQMREPHF